MLRLVGILRRRSGRASAQARTTLPALSLSARPLPRPSVWKVVVAPVLVSTVYASPLGPQT
jgi:hypothetical protein